MYVTYTNTCAFFFICFFFNIMNIINFVYIVTALWEEQEAPEYDIDSEDERWLKQQRHPELTGDLYTIECSILKCPIVCIVL